MFCAAGANDALPERLLTTGGYRILSNGIKVYYPFQLIYWDIIDIWAPKIAKGLRDE